MNNDAFHNGKEKGNAFLQIRQQHPVVHAITNPVTMHDVVNMILAAGGTAICADNAAEAADITGICDGLLLNIGMPNDDKLQAMLLAGRAANAKGIPVVLDPVGAGASAYRKKFLQQLLGGVHFSCIRCNMSEAAALMGITFASHGVEDAGVVLNREQMMQLAGEYHTILAVTGETDYTVTATQVWESCTGTPLEKEITGAGCMLSGVMAAGLAAVWKVFSLSAGAGRSGISDLENQDGRRQELDEEALQQAYAGDARALLQAYGECASRAEERMKVAGIGGTATFRTWFMDEVSMT